MQNIGDLLGKFSKFIEPDRLLREQISEILKTLNIEITWRDIAIKNEHVVFRNISPAARHEIVLQRERILNSLPEEKRKLLW